MPDTNEMKIIFDSYSKNERFARVTVASFFTQLNPTIEEISDVKTAVSEAVTNSIIHGYDNKKNSNKKNKIEIECLIENEKFTMIVKDFGKGIEDIELAMTPMYTTKAEEDRSGMGFSFMEAFMDLVEVKSEVGKGTIVRMEKTVRKGRNAWTTQSL